MLATEILAPERNDTCLGRQSAGHEALVKTRQQLARGQISGTAEDHEVERLYGFQVVTPDE